MVYTETHCAVPFLEGKSSIGWLGIDIHATAGKGDVGFWNTWTLEISCTHPVRVYEGMPIGQLIYFRVDGEIENLYHSKPSAKYTQRTHKPVESMMWKNDFSRWGFFSVKKRFDYSSIENAGINLLLKSHPDGRSINLIPC